MGHRVDCDPRMRPDVVHGCEISSPAHVDGRGVDVGALSPGGVLGQVNAMKPSRCSAQSVPLRWRPMRVYVSRDSVCMADDVEDHGRMLDVPDATTIDTVLEIVHRRYELPSIYGGLATWVLQSRSPISVVAQQWPSPRRLYAWWPAEVSDCQMEDGVLQLHYSYLAQIDPDMVFEVLMRLRLYGEPPRRIRHVVLP